MTSLNDDVTRIRVVDATYWSNRMDLSVYALLAAGMCDMIAVDMAVGMLLRMRFQIVVCIGC